ncbi:MAG: hypothetical protein JWR05_1995 [Mucilaginibacter sp.]|nr:hypothetical protein [Mucilaginibacter sp.]
MNKCIEFWNWFAKNNEAYTQLDIIDIENRNKLLNDFENQLHLYCDSLFFEIGGHPGKENELIITAEGNVDYFTYVEKLISCAPKIKNWLFIAFKPAIPGNFITNWEDIEINAKDVFFDPLKITDSNDIGIAVYIKQFDVNQENKYYNALFKMLDTILGEQSFAVDIKKVKILEKTPAIKDEDLIHISKLPNYIVWHNKKYFNK